MLTRIVMHREMNAEDHDEWEVVDEKEVAGLSLNASNPVSTSDEKQSSGTTGSARR